VNEARNTTSVFVGVYISGEEGLVEKVTRHRSQLYSTLLDFNTSFDMAPLIQLMKLVLFGTEEGRKQLVIGPTSEEKDMRTSWLADCGDMMAYAPTQKGAAD